MKRNGGEGDHIIKKVAAKVISRRELACPLPLDEPLGWRVLALKVGTTTTTQPRAVNLRLTQNKKDQPKGIVVKKMLWKSFCDKNAPQCEPIGMVGICDETAHCGPIGNCFLGTASGSLECDVNTECEPFTSCEAKAKTECGPYS